MNNDDFPGITPVHFFSVKGSCYQLPNRQAVEEKRYQLPATTELLGEEENFATVHLGWSKEGLAAHITVNQPFHQVSYPNVKRGDSIEFFIDTRDVKSSGYNTRFCHHFYFLPEAIEGHNAAEVTHFRGEEMHEHCDPSSLKVKTKTRKSSYELDLFIPADCLHGYDPTECNRIGFSYRINRPDGPSQHYTATSDTFKMEEQPSLWSSLKLEP